MKTPLDQLPWIWTAHNPDVAGQLGQFRLHFRAVKTATWTGFADTFYTLLCNGQSVGVGPTLSHHQHPYASSWDLTPFLRAGDNVLALAVWFDGRRFDIADANPLQASVAGVLEADGATILTGPQWKARQAGGYVMTSPEGFRGFASRRLIVADLRQEPANWADREFDDSDWEPARVLPAHVERGGLSLSPLPLLTCTTVPLHAVIDAGIARGDAPVVHAQDVAIRMIAQEHTSLIRPPSTATPLIGDSVRIKVNQLPDAALMKRLGWATDQPPLPIPAVDGEFFLTLDFGRQASGCVRLDIEAQGDLTIDVGYADALVAGRVNPRMQSHSFADRVRVGAGRRVLRMPHDRGFRYLQLTFSGAATLHAVTVEEHVYPFDDARRFRCSDATLNAIWDGAVETVRQCSLTTLVDNSRRERQGWGGPDLVVTNRAFMTIFGEARLVRKKFADFCDYFDIHGFIPCWAPGIGPWTHQIPAHDLWFPAGCWEYLLATDDREFGRRLLKASEGVMEYFHQRLAGGLLTETGGWKWPEWAFRSVDKVCTWENVLAVQAWQSIARMRRYLGQPGADVAEQRAAAIGQALVDRMWHSGHGALSQGVDGEGRVSDFCAQLDNALALLLDFLPTDKRDSAIRFCAGRSGTWPTNRSGWQGDGRGMLIRSDPRRPVVAGSPFASDLCAQAMFHVGLGAEAVQYMRYNFGSLLDDGEGTAWESWSIFHTDFAATCQSQSFGSGYVGTLLAEVVGLTYSAPGGAVVTWQPRRVGLAWAEGSLQTIYGPVTARWEGEKLEYSVPVGVTLRIVEPAGVREIHGTRKD